MKNLLLVLLLCLGMSSFAQNEITKWYFGRYTGLDFMSTPPSNVPGKIGYMVNKIIRA